MYITNKLIDNINLTKLLRSPESFASFPANSDILKNTGISYKYTPTIRNKITNYKATINSLTDSYACFCHLYHQFTDSHHGHVLTGDINIVGNPNLKSILSKGLNFREVLGYNIIKTYASIHSALDKFINSITESSKLQHRHLLHTFYIPPATTISFYSTSSSPEKENVSSNRLGTPPPPPRRGVEKPEGPSALQPTTENQQSAFSAWRKLVLNKVNLILEKSPKSLANPILSDPHKIQDLKNIQYRFVIVPVDKASNNVSFICKSFYKHILEEEIMKSGDFAPSNYTEKSIICKYTHLLSSYNIKDTFSNFIPFLYWIPEVPQTAYCISIYFFW